MSIGIGIGGVALLGFLSVGLYRAAKYRRGFARLALWAGLLLSTLGIGLWLASTFLPCFSLTHVPLCRGPQSEKTLALTFDDGPNEPHTSQILDILARYGVRATFFTVGSHMIEHPELISRMQREGHDIGNHTFTHRPLAFANTAEIERELASWESAFRGAPATLFRAPHGWKSPWLQGTLDRRGYRLIGWTHGVWDSDKPGTEILLKRLRKAAENGAIILLHDGDGDRDRADRSQTLAVLPEFIEYCKNQGFEFLTVNEME